ncbi:MAG TPA: hypothetical protein VLK29_08185 [Luteimonas sp.]|nr:hypothetical protein [Luteimonas sp.]
MKTALIACCLSALVSLSACSRDTDLAEVSDTTDTAVAPGAATSTDPEATMDEARRSTDPYASGAAQSGSNPMTPAQGSGVDPANTMAGDNNQTTGTGTGAGTAPAAETADGARAGTSGSPTPGTGTAPDAGEGNNETTGGTGSEVRPAPPAGG